MSRRGCRGGGVLGPAPTPATKEPGFLRLKCRKKGHWCPLNCCSTPFKHNMAIEILKSCKSVFEYVESRSTPSHIRSSIPWRRPLAEILDPRLMSIVPAIPLFSESVSVEPQTKVTAQHRQHRLGPPNAGCKKRNHEICGRIGDTFCSWIPSNISSISDISLLPILYRRLN